MPPQSFRFLDLPIELRFMVYERLPHHIKHHKQYWDTGNVIFVARSVSVAILATCKLVHHEAKDIVIKLVRSLSLRPTRLLVWPSERSAAVLLALMRELALHPGAISNFASFRSSRAAAISGPPSSIISDDYPLVDWLFFTDYLYRYCAPRLDVASNLRTTVEIIFCHTSALLTLPYSSQLFGMATDRWLSFPRDGLLHYAGYLQLKRRTSVVLARGATPIFPNKSLDVTEILPAMDQQTWVDDWLE